MNQRIVKIGRNIMFMLSIPVIIGAFVFADIATKKDVCEGVQIVFSDNSLSFVTKENVLSLLKSKGVSVNKTKLNSVNILQLEKTLEENKWIKNADIFMSANNYIHIKIEQRKPVVRIQPENNYEEPYYLDEYANTIPYSAQYVPNLPVVTLNELGYTSKETALKRDLVSLALFIQKDTFWNAAITQIAINENRRIDLIPALGNQIILLGDINNLQDKMNKLFEFYKQGYETVHWDKYDEIDLRFQGQIVCRNTRGERLSIDPYDKSTHQELLAKHDTNHVKKTPAVHTAKPATTVPAVAKKSTEAKAVSNHEKPKVITEKKKTESKPVASASKKEDAAKPKITEVKESKYFNTKQ